MNIKDKTTVADVTFPDGLKMWRVRTAQDELQTILFERNKEHMKRMEKLDALHDGDIDLNGEEEGKVREQLNQDSHDHKENCVDCDEVYPR